MKIPNVVNGVPDRFISLARIVSEDSQQWFVVGCRHGKSSKDS